MRWKPRSYQLRAVRWLLRRRQAGLFLDPGMGKTAITLAALRWFKITYPDDWNSAVVIAPIRAITTWIAEIEKWDQFNSLTYAVLQGDGREQIYDGVEADIWLVNPENAHWLCELIRASDWQFSALVIDESTKFKSPRSKRFKTFRTVLPRFERRYILTGSPAANGLLDLWAQIYLLDRGWRWGQRFDQWRDRHFSAKPWSPYVFEPNDGSIKKLTKAIRNLCLELKSKDYLDMPKIIHRTAPVHLSKSVMQDYRSIEKHAILKIPPDGKVTAANAATRFLKCQQITSGFIHDYKYDDKGRRVRGQTHTLHMDRVLALVDLLEQLKNRQILIAYWFKDELVMIKDALTRNNRKHSEVTADIETTSWITSKWNTGKLRTVVMHASSSHGLNMQGSDDHPIHIIWYGSTWSLEQYEQFNARIYRQGRSGKIIVHHMIAPNTIDEVMLERLHKKARTAKQLGKILKKYTIRQARLRSVGT